MLLLQVLEKEEAAEERQRQNRETGADRLKQRGLESLDRRQDREPAERLALAQALIQQRHCDSKRSAHRDERIREHGQNDMRVEFPAMLSGDESTRTFVGRSTEHSRDDE